MIKLQASCQVLKVCCSDVLVSDSLNAIKMQFAFTNEWRGLSKTVQFVQKDEETEEIRVYNVLLDDENIAMLPNEITTGTVLVSVFGVDGDTKRLTTNAVAFPVTQSGFMGDGQTPIPPTPDLYQQYVNLVYSAAGVPVIGENGNWHLNGIDTGIKADWSAEQENAAASAEEAAASAARAEAVKASIPEFAVTVEAMQKSNLRVGRHCRTAGFFTEGDGGGAVYEIVEDAEADGITVHALDNGLFARLVYHSEYPVEVFGVNTAGVDIADAMNVYSDGFCDILRADGEYNMKKTMLLNKHLVGKGTITLPMAEEFTNDAQMGSSATKIAVRIDASNCGIDGLTFVGQATDIADRYPETYSGDPMHGVIFRGNYNGTENGQHNVTLRNLTFRYIPGNALGIWTRDCYNVQIENVDIDQCGGFFIETPDNGRTNLGYAHNISISNVRTNTGCNSFAPVQGLCFTNCYFGVNGKAGYNRIPINDTTDPVHMSFASCQFVSLDPEAESASHPLRVYGHNAGTIDTQYGETPGMSLLFTDCEFRHSDTYHNTRPMVYVHDCTVFTAINCKFGGSVKSVINAINGHAGEVNARHKFIGCTFVSNIENNLSVPAVDAGVYSVLENCVFENFLIPYAGDKVYTTGCDFRGVTLRDNGMNKVYENLCSAFEATGGCVGCNPVMDYPLHVVSTIPADDVGVNKLILAHAGKNFLKPPTFTKTAETTFSPNADGSIHITAGTWTKIINYNSFYSSGSDVSIGYLLPTGTWTFSRQVLNGTKLDVSGAHGLRLHNLDGTLYSSDQQLTGQSKTFTIDSPKIAIPWLQLYAGTQSADADIGWQIESGDVMTDWESPMWEERTVEFAEALTTGGEYDWEKGTLSGQGPYVRNHVYPFTGVNYLGDSTGNLTVKWLATK